jgi:tRNA (mo5U34)-methyltransferase
MAAQGSLLEQVQSLNWAHTIDLGQGIVTPGIWPPSPLILRAFDEIDFRGKRVLDIGCWDGLWSFEAEKRGAAEVYATDHVTQRPFREQPTFQLAHQVLESRVRYYPDVSVYDLDQLGAGDFDIVLFCGVYYHLKDPLRALARLRKLMKTGGIIVVEGEVINDYDNTFSRFYYRDRHVGDPSNWWVPTIPCLRQWVECSYFEIVSAHNIAGPPPRPTAVERFKAAVKKLLGRVRPAPNHSRYVLTARAVCRRDPEYIYPDADLHAFNQEGLI